MHVNSKMTLKIKKLIREWELKYHKIQHKKSFVQSDKLSQI